MQYAKLSELSDEQLVHRELQLERELIDTSFRKKTGQLEDSSRLAKIRKDIARARTAQRERERAQSLMGNALREQYRASFKPGSISTEGGEGAGGFLKGIVDKVKSDE
jgi:large subunit ribosomal protein L29